MNEALLPFVDAPNPDNKAVTHEPILVPKITYKIEFPPLPIVIPAATIEIKIVVVALEDWISAVNPIPTKSNKNGLFKM